MSARGDRSERKRAGKRPGTGEARATRQPFHIDKLPPAVHRAIEYLRDRGKTWIEIAEQSARSYSEDWAKDDGGFVEWDKLELPVLELFPQLRLSRSNLQRWFDVRIEQTRAQVLAESAAAREFAQAFSSATIEGGNEAVLNAMRDQVFQLARSASVHDRDSFIAGLNVLTMAMSRIQRVDLAKQRVEVESRRVAQLEKDAELKRKRFQKEMDEAEKKVSRGEALTPEDINKIRQRVFGMGPAPVSANG